MFEKALRTRSLVLAGSLAMVALFALVLALGLAGHAVAAPALTAAGHPALAPSDVVTATILHTNDFHGRLDPENTAAYTTGVKVNTTGAAYVAAVINKVRAEKGITNTVLMDAGDEYFAAQPTSQLLLGEPTVDIFNMIGYNVAEFGNHEFDKGQTVAISRTNQAHYPWLGANIVVSGTDWTHPNWVKPWVTMTVGSGANQAVIGVIGVDTTEVPDIVIAGAVSGLKFKDPTDTIKHYYNEVKANADAVVLLAHIGTEDTGSSLQYKGLKRIARELVDAGMPVDLMIGGHAHQALTTPVVVSGTTIIEAGSYGYWVGQADISIDKAAKKLTVDTYTLLRTENSVLTPDPVIKDRVKYWNDLVAPIKNQKVGTTNISLTRDGNATRDAVIGDLVADSMLWKANQVAGKTDVAFTNAGGLRADILVPVTATLPYTVTWGDTFTVLPFGNTLYLMDMTGAQLQLLLDQSAKMAKGMLQMSGITHYYYNNAGNATATTWGAYGIKINGKPLERTKVYRVATNDFLAPGGDGFTAFTLGTNRVNLAAVDMQAALNEYIGLNSPLDTAKILGGRINRLDKVVTILHTNDIHGQLQTTTYQSQPEGMLYLASLIKAEKAHNPDALLLDGGDLFQGNSFAYYYRNLNPNPIAGTMNRLGYQAFTLGNHEFNFGSHSFTMTLSQLNMPILAANLKDNGAYSHGWITDHVKSYITTTVQGLNVAIFGLTNPRVPRYELPTNIEGLSFAPATATAHSLVPTIRATVKPDLLLGLTHIGYQSSDEPDSDVLMAQQTPGIDAIIGAHSHTTLNPSVMVTSTVNPTGTLVAQTGSIAMNLGKVNIGLIGNQIVLREGYLIPAKEVAPATDPALTAYLQPFVDQITVYNNTPIGRTITPIDATKAYTMETNGSNLQADAAIYELTHNNIPVDFHLSGAMSNKKAAPTASASNPYTLTVNDMFTLMPYENSLVVLRMNGPQLKAVLERGYRNYYYYKYVPGRGGYSYYTTCMLDTDKNVKIVYRDQNPTLPNGNNVAALIVNGQPVDFKNASKYYNVGSVNYLVAGSCNFNDNGVSLWPISQIVADTQFYVRDSVVDYIKAQSAPVNPQIEGRLNFLSLRRYFALFDVN